MLYNNINTLDEYFISHNAIYNLLFVIFIVLFKYKEVYMKNKRMKIARIECDMKQDDLAKSVGVTRQTIGLIESGNYNPTLNLCISICKALNKTLDDLFWEE